MEQKQLEAIAQRVDHIVNTAGVAMAFGRNEDFVFVSNTNPHKSKRYVNTLAVVTSSLQENPAVLSNLERCIRRYEKTYQDIEHRVEAGTLEGKFVEGVYIPKRKNKNYTSSHDYDSISTYTAFIFASPLMLLGIKLEKIAKKTQSSFAYKSSNLVNDVIGPILVPLLVISAYVVALPARFVTNKIVYPLTVGSSVRAFEKLEKYRTKVFESIPEKMLFKLRR